MKTKLTNKHFAILGVTKFSTKYEIKKAYWELIKIWHPDKFENYIKLQNEAQKKCKLINEAYSHFKDFIPSIKKQLAKPNTPNCQINKNIVDIKRMRVKSSKISSEAFVRRLSVRCYIVHPKQNIFLD